MPVLGRAARPGEGSHIQADIIPLVVAADRARLGRDRGFDDLAAIEAHPQSLPFFGEQRPLFQPVGEQAEAVSVGSLNLSDQLKLPADEVKSLLDRKSVV